MPKSILENRIIIEPFLKECRAVYLPGVDGIVKCLVKSQTCNNFFNFGHEKFCKHELKNEIADYTGFLSDNKQDKQQ